MGFGSDRKTYRYFSLRTMTGENENKQIDPAFVLSEKVNGQWVKGEACRYISGQLTDVKREKYVWQNRDVHQVILFLYDKPTDEYYKVEMGFGSLTRSILNSLMSIPDYKDIKIILYKSKSKTDGKDFAGAVVYWNCSTDNQKADWVIPAEDIKVKFNKVVIRGKEEWDSFPADEMVADLAIVNILPKLEKPAEHARPAVNEHGLPPSDLQPEPDNILDQTREERAARESRQLDEDLNAALEGDDLPF